MKYNKNNKKGLTLIETIAYMSLFSLISLSAFELKVNYQNKIEKETFSNNVSDLMEGIDKRLSIDGFNSNLWNTKQWSNSKDVADILINEELRPSSSYSKFSVLMNKEGCTGEWIPQNLLDEKSNLVQCNMWKSKIPLDLEVEAKMIEDGSGYIEKFEMLFSFKNEKDFTDNFILLRDSYKDLKNNKTEGLSGNFEYFFVNSSNNEIGISECLSIKEDCLFKTVFDRSGGNEELRVDGQNQMINSQVTFMKSDEDSPLACVHWRKDDSDIWVKSSEEHNCGIGIYKEDGYPLSVEVLAENGNFENVMLNKECNLFNWDNVSNKLTIDNSRVSACGFTENNDEIFQVIENIKATNGYAQNFYFKELDVKFIDSNNIIAKDINTTYLEVKNTLTVDGLTKLNMLDVYGHSDIDGQAYANNKLKVSGDSHVLVSTISDQAFTTYDLTVDGDTNSNNLNGESLIANEVYAHQEINTNLMSFTSTFKSGDSCTREGYVSKKDTGATLVCKKGKWTNAVSGVPVGTINAWTSKTIPAGWLKCNGATIPSKYSELRSLVGSTTPDLRGRFVRGWVNNGNSGHDPDYNRGIRSYQAEEIKSHTHRETRFSGSDNSGSGKVHGADDRVATSYTGWSGIESRPKNYSVIFIIKAE